MSALSENDPRLVFVPLEKAVIPPSGLIEHFKDRFWAVHPVKGLVFWDKRHMAPQCNGNESIARTMRRMYPWAEIKFISSVFRKINPSDYV